MWLCMVCATASKFEWEQQVIERWMSKSIPVEDEALTAHWRAGPDGDLVWSREHRAAVKEALKIELKLKLPRVFIYSYPPELVNDDYFGLVLGKYLTEEKWRGNRWSPSKHAMGRFRTETRHNCHQGDCVLRINSQHALGILIHRSLETGYANLVDSPDEADLFFIPDYFDRSLSTAKDPCARVGAAWNKHLASFGYLQKNMSDHFIVVGRAWHRAADASIKNAIKMNHHEECDYHKDWPAHRIYLEAQDPFQRACNRKHTAPYGSFLPWTPSDTWGHNWFKHRQRNLTAAAFFTARDELRTLLHRQCHDMDSCFLPPEWQSADKLNWEFIYRTSVFALQPPGFSAARKGIVDALMAGSIPVLIKKPMSDTNISAKDQRNLWPWQWPAQGASSIAVTEEQVKTIGIDKLLKQVDEEQLALMRAVIASQVAGLAYPLMKQQKTTQVNAIDLTMHHLFYVSKFTKPSGNDCRLRSS